MTLEMAFRNGCGPDAEEALRQFNEQNEVEIAAGNVGLVEAMTELIERGVVVPYMDDGVLAVQNNVLVN